MTLKMTNEAGEEIEVYTADEVQTRESAAATAKEAEYKPQIEKLNGELTDAQKRAAERAGEFAQFRELSKEQVAKLGEAERTIYENGVALENERKKNSTLETDRITREVNATIAKKVGNDAKVVEKVRSMYEMINLNAVTPEEIEIRVNAAIGAIGTTAPDIAAQINGFSGGSFAPPTVKKEGEQSYADTEQGKAAANALGLVLEAPKK